MALGILKKEKSMDGVAAGSKATSRITPQGVHFAVFLRALTAGGVELTAAQVAASMGTVEIKLNGETKVQARAGDLINLYAHKAGNYPGANRFDTLATQIASAAVVPFRWVDDTLDNAPDRLAYGVGMSDVNSYEITAEILNPAGATAIGSVEVYVDYEPNAILPLGAHRTLITYPRNFASTGQREETNLPLGNALEGLKALYYVQRLPTASTPGALAWLRVRADNRNIHEDTPPTVNACNYSAAGCRGLVNLSVNGFLTDVQTSVYKHHFLQAVHFDESFVKRAFLDQTTMRDVRITENWATTPGGAFDILIEMVKGLNAPNTTPASK